MTLNVTIYSWCYRTLMKVAHRFNWHYAPPIYPDGDAQLWCKWCGFRETIKRRNGDRVTGIFAAKADRDPSQPKNHRPGGGET